MLEIIKVEKKELLDYFTEVDGLQPVLKKIEAIADDFVSDTTSKTGIAKIKSNVTLIVKSKTHLDELRKDLTQEWRDKTVTVNSEWKKAEKFLNDLRDKTREALTVFEKEQKAKIAVMEDKINYILFLKNIDSSAPATDIKNNLDAAEKFEVTEDIFTEEFEFKAFKAKDQTVKTLKEKLEARIKYDKEQEELKQLRVKEDKRQKEEEARLAIEEEKRLENEKILNEKRIAEEATIKAELKAKSDAEKAERQIEQAKQDKINAEKAAVQAEKDAANAAKEAVLAQERAVEAATQAERKRIENEAKARKEQEAIKLKDVKHKSDIEHFIAIQIHENIHLDKMWATKVVNAISKGLIDNIQIKY